MDKNFDLGLNVLGIYLGIVLVAIVSTIAVIPLFIWSLFQPESGQDIIDNIVGSF